jgi:hypothetical protein
MRVAQIRKNLSCRIHCALRVIVWLCDITVATPERKHIPETFYAAWRLEISTSA